MSMPVAIMACICEMNVMRAVPNPAAAGPAETKRKPAHGSWLSKVQPSSPSLSCPAYLRPGSNHTFSSGRPASTG